MRFSRASDLSISALPPTTSHATSNPPQHSITFKICLLSHHPPNPNLNSAVLAVCAHVRRSIILAKERKNPINESKKGWSRKLKQDGGSFPSQKVRSIQSNKPPLRGGKTANAQIRQGRAATNLLYDLWACAFDCAFEDTFS